MDLTGEVEFEYPNPNLNPKTEHPCFRPLDRQEPAIWFRSGAQFLQSPGCLGPVGASNASLDRPFSGHRCLHCLCLALLAGRV